MPSVVSKDGLRIHFEASGSGTPVILLHPANATCRSWIDLGWFESLQSRGCRAVSLDARGFGESDDVETPEQLSPRASTDDIASVMDTLGIESAHLCGFSLGAAAAVRFSVDQPSRVDSLILGGLALGPLVQVGLYLGRSAEEARRRALTQLDRVKHTSSRATNYFSAVQAVMLATPLRCLAAADLRSPILGVVGEADHYDPVALYEDLRASGARIQLKIIPNVGHGACFPHAEFRRAALDFIAAPLAV
jgi:non-heme chloroperoxidase